jgi:hypothetical protein
MRNGRFTSSEVGKIIPRGRKEAFTVAGLTYIRTKMFERVLGRRIDSPVPSRSTAWGLLAEKHLFETLGMSYQPMGNEVKVHPQYDFWSGSPDAFNHQTQAVVEIKCPFTLKSFCELVEPVRQGLDGMDAMNMIRELHQEGEMYYWQIVSNCILMGTDRAELIVFCPCFDEALKIQAMSLQIPEAEQERYRPVYYCLPEELPYLPDECQYRSLNVVRLEIAREDMELLTSRVIEANELCEQWIRLGQLPAAKAGELATDFSNEKLLP